MKDYNLDEFEEEGHSQHDTPIHGRDLLPEGVRAALTVPNLNEIGGCPVTLCKPYLGTRKERRNHSNTTLGTWVKRHGSIRGRV